MHANAAQMNFSVLGRLWRCASCSVLDLGAGSGLLAILAAQLGAIQVLALEATLGLHLQHCWVGVKDLSHHGHPTFPIKF